MDIYTKTKKQCAMKISLIYAKEKNIFRTRPDALSGFEHPLKNQRLLCLILCLIILNMRAYPLNALRFHAWIVI